MVFEVNVFSIRKMVIFGASLAQLSLLELVAHGYGKGKGRTTSCKVSKG
jgi:hypothetical protein